MKIRVVENEDKEKVKRIHDKIKENKGHCCCAIVFDKDNICMCKEFRDKIKRGETGFCHCGLYQAIEDDK